MKKWIAILAVLTLALSLFAACGTAEASSAAPAESVPAEDPASAPAEEPAEEPAPESAAEPAIGMPNPMREVTAEELDQELGLGIAAPEGAENVCYFIINPDMAQIDFTYEGKAYTYRAQATAETSPVDISGMFFTWNETKEADLSGRPAVLQFCDEASSMYWLDVAPGIAYSLSSDSCPTEEELLNVAGLVFAPVQGEADGE